MNRLEISTLARVKWEAGLQQFSLVAYWFPLTFLGSLQQGRHFLRFSITTATLTPALVKTNHKNKIRIIATTF